MNEFTANESMQKLHDLAIDLKKSAKNLNDFRTGLGEILNSINPLNFKEELIINKLRNMLDKKAIHADRYKNIIIEFIKNMISQCETYIIINISNIDTPEGQIKIIRILLRFMKQQEKLSPEIPVKHSPNLILLEENPNVLVKQSTADSIATFLENNLIFYYKYGTVNEHIINFCKLLEDFCGHVNANFIELSEAYTYQHQEHAYLKNLREQSQYHPFTRETTLPHYKIKNILKENSNSIPSIENPNNKYQEEI